MKKLAAVAVLFMAATTSTAQQEIISANIEKSVNVQALSPVSNDPGRFLPGLPSFGVKDVWTGVMILFDRDPKATEYGVEISFIKGDTPDTVVSYVQQKPATLNRTKTGFMPEMTVVPISKDAFDFTITKVTVHTLSRTSRSGFNAR
jgi:hypothetical protein